MTKRDIRIASLGIGYLSAAIKVLEEAAFQMTVDPYPEEMSEKIEKMANNLQLMVNEAIENLEKEEAE